MIKKIEYNTSHFDFILINHIKNLRESRKISQETLSLRMGLSKSFVGNVESFKEVHKYSTRHITLLAKAFGFEKINDLLDFPTPEFDRIKVTVEQTYEEDETNSKKSVVIKIEEIKD